MLGAECVQWLMGIVVQKHSPVLSVFSTDLTFPLLMARGHVPCLTSLVISPISCLDPLEKHMKFLILHKDSLPATILRSKPWFLGQLCCIWPVYLFVLLAFCLVLVVLLLHFIISFFLDCVFLDLSALIMFIFLTMTLDCYSNSTRVLINPLHMDHYCTLETMVLQLYQC